jgi:hypothetical protein
MSAKKNLDKVGSCLFAQSVPAQTRHILLLHFEQTGRLSHGGTSGQAMHRGHCQRQVRAQACATRWPVTIPGGAPRDSFQSTMAGPASSVPNVVYRRTHTCSLHPPPSSAHSFSGLAPRWLLHSTRLLAHCVALSLCTLPCGLATRFLCSTAILCARIVLVFPYSRSPHQRIPWYAMSKQ